MNVTIWVSYHSNEIYNKYKLNELDTSIYKLFNTSEYYPALHKYFAEFINLYHVYKNNIKSDVIGFCHYRRYFDLSTIDFNDVYDNNKLIYYKDIYYWDLNGLSEAFPKFKDISFFKLFLNYLNENNIKLKHSINYYNHNKISIVQTPIIICKYNTFLYVAKILFDYVNYIFPNWENNDFLIVNYFKNDPRIFSLILEQLFGFLCANIEYNNILLERNKKLNNYLTILNTLNNNEINCVKNIYINKLLEGFEYFYVLNNTNFNLDEIFHGCEFNRRQFKIINSIDEIKNINYTII